MHSTYFAREGMKSVSYSCRLKEANDRKGRGGRDREPEKGKRKKTREKWNALEREDSSSSALSGMTSLK